MWLWDCARAWAGQASGSDVDAAGRELKDQNVISGSLGGEHALLSTFGFFFVFFFVCFYRGLQNWSVHLSHTTSYCTNVSWTEAEHVLIDFKLPT